MEDKLNDRQEKFLQEYLVDFNATQAAIRAGYSKKTAAAAASRLLRNVKVSQRLKELQTEMYENAEIDRQEILEQLADVAFYDIHDYVEVCDGSLMKLRDIDALPPKKRRAIKTIRNGKYGIEIEFDSRVKSLGLLMDYFGMKKPEEVNQDEENTGIVMMPERMEREEDDDYSQTDKVEE